MENFISFLQVVYIFKINLEATSLCLFPFQLLHLLWNNIVSRFLDSQCINVIYNSNILVSEGKNLINQMLVLFLLIIGHFLVKGSLINELLLKHVNILYWDVFQFARKAKKAIEKAVIAKELSYGRSFGVFPLKFLQLLYF